MSFYGKYNGMGGGGGVGVISLDGLAGALTLVPGTGISIADGVTTITISSTSAGDVTIGAFGSTPNANGLSINGSQVLNMQPADATRPGGVSITTQSFAGQKTFTTGLTGTLTGHSTLDLALTGGTMSGAIAMGANKITGVASGTVSGDALQFGQIGAANGIAPLDGSGKVPYANLPAALMTFKGAWDPTTNTPTLANGTGLAGDTYRASVGGVSTAPLADTWFAGDFIIYNGSIWQRSPLADGVISVNGMAGSVILVQGNLTDVGTDGITITNGTNAVWGSGTSIVQHVADTTHNGYLSSVDWNTFNSKQASGNYITALTGDGTASGPGSSAFTLTTVNANVGTFASVTVNTKGLVTAATALSGDATTSSAVLTLATVNGNVGSFGSSTSIPSFTVNAKGLITAASGNAVVAPAGTLSGTTLNSTVVSSSLISVGTIATGVWNGTTIAIANGGTGQTTKAPAFDALSPMTTGGDLIYGGASGTGTRLANGSSGLFLRSNGGTAAPTWAAPTVTFTAPLVTTHTSSTGTHTFTGSPLYVRVRMVGGGGGGAGSGTAAGTAATDGGISSFGTSLLTANGGGHGLYGGSGGGGSGGVASLGSGPAGTALTGGSGTGANQGLASVGQNFAGGPGASSPFGGEGGGGDQGSAGMAASTNTGSGGGGAGLAGAGLGTFSGSGGGAGGFVDAVISGSTLSGLSGSAAWVVGAKGSGGTAGANGFAGGDGGSGYIEVTEYYQ